jgi:hypothetical protein
MGKTILIAALLLATAPACAATVTHCHTHISGDNSDKDCESKETLPTEEDVAAAHHIHNFWERRQEWRKANCGMVNEWGQLKDEPSVDVAAAEAGVGVSQPNNLWGTIPIGMRKYVFDQCQKSY